MYGVKKQFMAILQAYFSIFLLASCGTGSSQGRDYSDNLDIGAMVQPVPLENKFIDPSYFVWCGSVTKGNYSISQLERPCLYLEDGIPKYLFGANRADKEMSLSFNVAVPLKSK
jgi:hypothetical protein